MESETDSELRDKFDGAENGGWRGTWRTKNKTNSRRSADSGYGEGNVWEEEEKSGITRNKSATSSLGSVFSTESQVSEHGTEEVFEELTPTPDHRDKDMITNSRKISANICTEPCWYCKEDIDIRGGILAIKGRPCHPTCIICHYCKTQVESGPGQCLVDDKMTVTCEQCHEKVCPVCKELCLEEDLNIVRESSVGKVYHLGCLLCSQCGKSFSEDDTPKLANDGSYRHEGCDSSEPTRRNSKHQYYDREFANEVPERAAALSDYEVQMLRSHNDIRERHGVNPVLWSKKLAARARRWAIRLTVLNKSYPATSIYIAAQKDAPFGQNIGVVFNRKSAGSIVKQSVKTWYDGAAKVYDYSNGNPDQELCGFTQMIWDKTTRIGGCLTWFGNIGFVVMNYWPPGNLRGQFLRNVFPLLLPGKEGGLETVVLDKDNFMKFVDVDRNGANVQEDGDNEKVKEDGDNEKVKEEDENEEVKEDDDNEEVKGRGTLLEKENILPSGQPVESDSGKSRQIDKEDVTDVVDSTESTESAQEGVRVSDSGATMAIDIDGRERATVDPEKSEEEFALGTQNVGGINLGEGEKSEDVSNERPEDENEVMRPRVSDQQEDEYEVMRPSVSDQQEDEYEVMRPSVSDQQEDEYEVMRPSVSDQQEDGYEVMRPSVSDQQEDEYEVMRPSVSDQQEDEYEVMRPSVSDQLEDEYEVMRPSVSDQQEDEYEVMRPSVSLSEKQNDSPFSPQILEEGEVFSPEGGDYHYENEPIYMELNPEDDYMELQPTNDYEPMNPSGKTVYENGHASKNTYDNTNKYDHDYLNMTRVDDYDYDDHDYETLSKFRKSKEEPIYDLPTPITIAGGLSGAIFLYSQPPGFEGNVSEESVDEEGDYKRGAVLEELVTEGLSSDDEGTSVQVDTAEVDGVQVEEIIAGEDKRKALIENLVDPVTKFVLDTNENALASYSNADSESKTVHEPTDIPFSESVVDGEGTKGQVAKVELESALDGESVAEPVIEADSEPVTAAATDAAIRSELLNESTTDDAVCSKSKPLPGAIADAAAEVVSTSLSNIVSELSLESTKKAKVGLV